MDHPKTSLSFITASIFLKVITININPTFLFPIKTSPPLISILKAHYFWPCGTQHVICRPLTTNSWWEFRSAVFFFLWSWCVFTTLIFIQINCLMLSLKESDSFKQFKNLRNQKSNLIWSRKMEVWIWVTEKDISELEKYWNETLSTENEKSRSLPRFRSLEPYSLTLARRESENNREDSYQLSASVLI